EFLLPNGDCRENPMSQHDQSPEWPPRLGVNDPPIDFSREEAAYQRERERLVRDHLGKIAVVCKDEVVGVFDTAEEALVESFRRFGFVKMMFREICDPEEPDFVSLVDINHPSVRRLE